MLKNTVGKWRVKAFNAAGSVTGDAANITAKIAKDFGTPTALADVHPIEAEDGYYYFDLTANETNGDWLELFPESSTSGVEVLGVPTSQSTESAASVGGSSGSGTVADAMANPAAASADGVSVTQHKLADMIAAEKYLASKAAANDKRGGIRFAKLIPPGATS